MGSSLCLCSLQVHRYDDVISQDQDKCWDSPQLDSPDGSHTALQFMFLSLVF